MQTPRFCGFCSIAGTLDLAFCGSRPLRTSWLIVGIYTLLSNGSAMDRHRNHRYRPVAPRWSPGREGCCSDDGRRVDDHAMQEGNREAVIPAPRKLGGLGPPSVCSAPSLQTRKAAPVSRKTLHPAADERCRITLPPARGTHPHPIRMKGAVRASLPCRGPKATEKLRETRRNGNVQLCISTASKPARDARL